MGREKEIVAAEKFPLPDAYIEKLLDYGLEAHADAYRLVVELVDAIGKKGGLALLIGGSVRDVLFGKISKDFDLEVYGLEASQIAEIVKEHGKVDEVGAAFGILKLFAGKGLDIDVSLPRTDSKIGEGHRGFEVKTNPHMSIADAALRRDFTMNTIAANPLTGEIFDAHGGVKDILARRLKITDPELFADDPLRILRGMQFVGRFGLEIDAESVDIMRQMVPRLREIPAERFLEEWKKLFLKSEKPSLGLSAATTLGVMRELYPQFIEIEKSEGLTEGGGVDSWIHTMAAVDEAAKIIRRDKLDSDNAFILMLATFCGNLTHGHESGGRESVKSEAVELAKAEKFLASIKADNKVRDKVLALIASRHVPAKLYLDDQIREKAVSDGQIRRLAKQIHPATIQELALLAEAVHLGWGAFGDSETRADLMMPKDSFEAREWLIERAHLIGVIDAKPADLIQGRDLKTFGYKPGKEFGQLIKLANDLRDERGFMAEEVFAALDGVSDVRLAVSKLEELLNG